MLDTDTAPQSHTDVSALGSAGFGLGARVAIVIALAAIPAAIFLGVWVETQRRAALDEAHQWTQRMASLTAEQHADFYRAVRSTLEMLAISPSVKHADAAGCTELLQETQRRRPWMGSGWVVDDNGHVVCGTDDTTPPRLDAETRAAMTRDGFGLSDVMNGGSEPTLLAGMNVMSRDGPLHMIVESRVRFADLEKAAALPEQRDASVVIAVDRKGQALTYTGHHEHVGKVVTDHPTLQQAVTHVGAAVEGAAHDGIDRVFAAAEVPEWGAKVIVGIGRDTVIATSERSLITGIGMALTILLLTGGIGWISADWLIIRSVRVVRDAATAMADGAFGRRANVGRRAPLEIRQLAAAFNRMIERLERLALHDQLTGLPNRRYVGSKLADIEKAAKPIAVMLVDADQFKQVNDRHGHAVGDIVLKALADRLSDAVGEDGFCARVGGDEFAVVVLGNDIRTLPLHLLSVSERVRAALSVPVECEGTELVVTGSIGAAVRDATVANFIQLFHNADRALYAAKAAGRNCVVIFDGTQPDTIPDNNGMRTMRTAAA
ncbi:MAG TPA: GGDEF domain-containing protein [Bauldia sp.]|nr:GGDEF domain-containing protein [Bauldia sp.]